MARRHGRHVGHGPGHDPLAEALSRIAALERRCDDLEAEVRLLRLAATTSGDGEGMIQFLTALREDLVAKIDAVPDAVLSRGGCAAGHQGGGAACQAGQTRPRDDMGYDTTQVAELLGKSEWVVRQLCNKGTFPNAKKKPGGRGDKGEWRVPPGDVNAYLACSPTSDGAACVTDG